MLEHDEHNVFRILPRGNRDRDLVQQADTVQLLLQIRRPLAHALFQFVINLIQSPVACLNLRQHAVETIYQLAQLIIGLFHRPEGIVFIGGNLLGSMRQMGNRT